MCNVEVGNFVMVKVILAFFVVSNHIVILTVIDDVLATLFYLHMLGQGYSE